MSQHPLLAAKRLYIQLWLQLYRKRLLPIWALSISLSILNKAKSFCYIVNPFNSINLFFFRFYGPRLRLCKNVKKEFGQYPAMLTSNFFNNTYILVEIVHLTQTTWPECKYGLLSPCPCATSGISADMILIFNSTWPNAITSINCLFIQMSVEIFKTVLVGKLSFSECRYPRY